MRQLNIFYQSKLYLTMINFPPDIALLEYKGVRYQQDWESQFEGREFGATYLSATDIQSSKLLWITKLCDCIKFSPGGPSGFGTVDIAKITLGPGKNALTVETTIDSRYLLDLQTHTATRLAEPMPVKKPTETPPAYPSASTMPPPWPRAGNKKK